MRFLTDNPALEPTSVLYTRCTVDPESGGLLMEDVPCRNLEDVLGGFGRTFQMLAERDIRNAYVDENPLIVNVGLLTGSHAMTGMRTYFSGYSPIKQSKKGLPAAMWSAGSGKFGAKLKWTGLDELVIENRSAQPIYIVIPGNRGWPGGDAQTRRPSAWPDDPRKDHGAAGAV